MHSLLNSSNVCQKQQEVQLKMIKSEIVWVSVQHVRQGQGEMAAHVTAESIIERPFFSGEGGQKRDLVIL